MLTKVGDDIFADNTIRNLESRDQYDVCRKRALLQIVGGDKLIIPFC